MVIKFNYNQTIGQAKLLDELAADMQNSAEKKLGEIAANIEAAWTGDVGKAYLQYVHQLQNDTQKQRVYLRQIAEFLRSAAKKMQQAEAEAKATAQKI